MSMQRLNNPSHLPEGVVEGYQQQNYNMAAARVGLDTTNPFDDGTTITIPIGGVVEVNGVMYRITSQWSQTKPNANTAYWIVVVPSADGSTATFALVTRPGVWNSQRQGCYFTNNTQGHNNRRTLNWVSRGNLNNIPPTNMPGDAYSRSTKINRDIISLARGWYFVRLSSGGGGGDGGISSGPWGSIGAGGVAVNRLGAQMIFFADKPFYEVKVGGSGQNGSAGGTAGNANGPRNGGGGGGGSGEESVFDGFSTGMVPPGNGGDGQGGGFGGRNGCHGANGGMSRGGRAGNYFGGGGGGGAGNVYDDGTAEGTQTTTPGGAGGNGGDGGQSQAEGTAGGSCNIFLLGN